MKKIAFTVLGLVCLALLFFFVVAPRFIRVCGKSPQSEAKINLATFYEAEEGYYGEFNSYTDDWSQIAFTPSGTLRFYSLEWSATPESFAMTAVGNIDDDPTLDIWYVTEEGRDPVCASNDVTDNP